MTATRIKKSNGTSIVASAYCKTASKFVGTVPQHAPPTPKPYEALLPIDKIGDAAFGILGTPNDTIAIIGLESCGCSGKLQGFHPSSEAWESFDHPKLESALIQGGRSSLRYGLTFIANLRLSL